MPERGNKTGDAAGGLGALVSTARRLARDAAPFTGARTLTHLNQPDGFDCPGCAWPEPGKASRFEFCENGAKAVAFEATGKRAGPELFAAHPVADLRGRSDHWLEDQGRLTQPMRYDGASDTYRPVSWEDAFAEIASVLDGLDDPDEAVFYTSGRTSNEAAFLYQLLGRRFGTNNFPDCSNMCHESSGVGLSESIGIGKGTVTLGDFEKADAIFVIGQNPGTNHPRMLTELQLARERGAKIVSLNPLRERALVEFAHPKRPWELLTGRGTAISTHYLQVMVGGDLAALTGIAKAVLAAEDAAPGTILDRTFLEEQTTGFEEYVETIRDATWETIERESGLSRRDLEEVARVYVEADAVIACWAMGLTQQKHAVATIQQVTNLLFLRGNMGREGAGACPVRGHSNVQGDRTVGITEKPAAAFLDRLGEEFGFTAPVEHGFDTVGAIEAMAQGRVRLFVGMGGNFVAASPDTEYTAGALERCDLTVHVSTKLNRSHTVVGKSALILPCLGRTERDVQASGPQKVTVEDSMSVVHASQGRNDPASGDLRSEPAIVGGIGRACRRTADLPWDELVGDYGRIRERIARVLPDLFQDFNARIERPGGFYLGNTARDRAWKTESGRARFVAAPVPELTLPAGQLRLMTMRSHDQFNTTIYELDDRYRGVSGTRDVLFLSRDDLESRGLADGDLLDIESHFDDGRFRVVSRFRAIEYDIPRGCAAGYFPELNPLVAVTSFADRSRTPTSKFVPITVRAASPD